MFNKELITKTIDVAEHLYLGTQIKITKDNETNIYEVKEDDYGVIELISLSKEDEIWNDADYIDDLKENLIISVVRGNFQNIELV
jgi:hypothetical protein